MRRGGQVFGIILVVIGGLFLLSELGILNEIYATYHISLGSIISSIIGAFMALWPLLLVALGITIIFRKEWVSRIVWIVFMLAIISYAAFAPTYFPHNGMMWVWNDNWNDKWENGNQTTTEQSSYSETIDYTAAMKKGAIDIEVGAGSTSIKSDPSKAAVVESNGGAISNYWEVNGDTLELNIGNLESLDNIGDFAGDNQLSLGDKLVWEIVVETGASDFDADLRNLKVEKIDFSMGAGSATIRLSDKLPAVNLDIEAGASSVTVYVPKASGILIESESGLSSISIDDIDLSTNGESSYKSDNYASAENKAILNVSAGVSSIEIIKY